VFEAARIVARSRLEAWARGILSEELTALHEDIQAERASYLSLQKIIAVLSDNEAGLQVAVLKLKGMNSKLFGHVITRETLLGKYRRHYGDL